MTSIFICCEFENKDKPYPFCRKMKSPKGTDLSPKTGIVPLNVGRFYCVPATFDAAFTNNKERNPIFALTNAAMPLTIFINMTIFESIILALIEGLTEFLPISSTGHMIMGSKLLNIDGDFVKTFEISIQLGAIMAIVMLYAKRFLQSFTIYLKLGIAFIPTGIVGFLAYKTIKMYLFNPYVVGVALVIGGIILVLIDKKVVARESKTLDLESISYKNSFLIGLIQCISMIPGVSRAAATIIGGVFNGLDKKQATEFSFLLAVPTMFAATGYELIKTPIHFTSHENTLLAIGLVIAFISAWAAVKIFIRLVEHYGFKYFGYYRIVIGLLFLLFIRF